MAGNMSMYSASVPQLSKMLTNVLGWLDKAEQHAAAKKYDPNILLAQRLAPDMFPLVRQIQTACDNAKFIAARLSGKEAPRHPDTETTLVELRARILSTLDFLATVSEADFVGAAERLVRLPYLPENKRVLGHHYLNQNALPNFYFHVTTAYAILRHSGVDVGKTDFLGGLPLVDA